MQTLFWAVALSLPILPNLWCIWHASRHDFPRPEERAQWVRAGTFAPVIGGVLYLLIGMRRARPLRELSPDQTPAAAPDGTANPDGTAGPGEKPEPATNNICPKAEKPI